MGEKVFAIVAVFAIASFMLRMWLSHQEKMKGLSMTEQGLAPSDQRLARVEQAVEAIAIEVERISEGQRYVTKLMSESAPVRVEGRVPGASRVDTPH